MGPEMGRQVDINKFSKQIFEQCGLDPTKQISKEQFIEGCKKNNEFISFLIGEK
ncbi:hypothetical protein I4U23_005293 [Adineta vaga]|nr:hypothetical protein I4U23_005293 [Adineta vaga]